MEKKDLIAVFVAATTICSGLNVGCNDGNNKSSEKPAVDTLKHIPDPNPAGSYDTAVDDSLPKTEPKNKLDNDSTRKQTIGGLKYKAHKNKPA